jgi:predicted nucleic acid-binding Zn ribbon protein
MTVPGNENGAPHQYGDLRGPDLARAALAAARRRARQIEEGRAARRGSAEARSRRSSARPDERDPQPLEATLARLLAEAGWEAPAAVGGIIHGWADIVGPRIAAHCEPVSYEDGVLTVQTDSSAWATELRNLAGMLLTRLNSAVPRRAVLGGPPRPAIERIAVLGPNPPSWRRNRLSANKGAGGAGAGGGRSDRRTS